MNPLFTPEQMASVSAAVNRQMGLHFPPERWRELARGIKLAAQELGFRDRDAFVLYLLSGPLPPPQLAVLARHLTVAETYFYREPASLAILREEILRPLIAARRGRAQQLRLWSAGCCTGEEPYTLAMLLREMLPDWADWDITIWGTDINPESLKKAAAGIYTEWSFRDTPAWLRARYFQPHGKSFELRHDVRKMVSLQALNLADDLYPAWANPDSMDVILCRNVLMYFSPPEAGRIVRKFHGALAAGGWFISSPGEVSLAEAAPLVRRSFPQAILFQKASPMELPAIELPVIIKSVDWQTDWTAATEPPLLFAAEEILPSTPVCTAPERENVIQEISHQTALALFEQGEFAAAAAQLERLLDEPDMPGGVARGPSILLLARAVANQGRLTEALAWCEKGLAEDKLAASLHYLSGTILQSLGQPEAAIGALGRALYLEPDFILGHYSLGHIRHRQGRLKDASRHFKNALLLLQPLPQEECLPEAEGLTAGRLTEIIRAVIDRELTGEPAHV